MPGSPNSARDQPAEPVGKRVGGALYVHAEALGYLDAEAHERLWSALECAGAEAGGWNVAKIPREAGKVSLLRYERFLEDPFPSLARAVSVDISTGRVRTRTYDPEGNPPILHRKELLLPPGHAQRETFTALTSALEARGLLKASAGIGHRRQWWDRLAAHGLTLDGHALRATDGVAPTPDASAPSGVYRHKTAIARNQLSGPMQALARHGFLDGDREVFDYGCGRGDDVTTLTTAGITASGWDPHYAPHAPLAEADVVNLGFVLNVIEDPEEREEALRQAYRLARQVLSVAVMTVGRADVSGLKPYRDGFLTARRTFQKYFSEREARDLVAQVTGEEAIPVAPGVFLAFRDKIAEQRFLERRSRRHRDISHLLSITPSRQDEQGARDALIESHRDLLAAVWDRALELGRMPHLDELGEHTGDSVREQIGSVRRAMTLAQSMADPAELTGAREARVTDLTVYFALNLFAGRRRYGHLPVELQRDVKAFFGAHARAEDAARELLFSVGDREQILEACQAAERAGIGFMFGDHSLQLHTSQIGNLPSILRVYVGCAEQLFGVIDESTADLVKIHVASGKLTLLRYDDFFGKALPRLIERVKIRMADQDIDFFDYRNDKAAPRLTMKSRYMSKTTKSYKKQWHFDQQLAELGLFNLERHGPDATKLAQGLTHAGVRIAGFRLIKNS